MASRNERKRAAKARKLELLAAVESAFALEKSKLPRIEVISPKRDVYDVPNAIRTHRPAMERFGVVVKGKFQAKALPEPAKRKLELNRLTGKMIERKKSYI